MKWAAACLTLSLAAMPIAAIGAERLDDCRSLVHHGKSSEARRCFGGLLASADPFLRAEGYWGLERYEDANNEFRTAQREHPKSAQIDVEWGRLFLARFNNEERMRRTVLHIG